ncbi:MAG: hypothetical protein U5O39_04970 [Gammaproteobacteria bacterium]|nr:hypothetical protein [Gammaproteobacteria bacterium]
MDNIDLAAQLRDKSPAITELVISKDYARRPELIERYGERGRAFYKRNNDYHLSFLAEGVANEDAVLFVDYVTWARSMLTSHGVLLEDPMENLRLPEYRKNTKLPELSIRHSEMRAQHFRPGM